jgi:hypothetical protein
MTSLRFAAAAIPLLLATRVLADWSPDFRVTTDPESSNTGIDGGRNVIVEDGFVMIVWSDDRDGNREIYFRERLNDVWGAPVRLTTNAGSSTHPAIGRFPGEVRVVFEDDRTGHPEIWTKRKTMGIWSPDSCLTCDDFESSRPSLDYRGIHLVWEETKDGNREIYHREHPMGGVWGPAFRVSSDGGESSHPSVASPTEIDFTRGAGPLVLVVWQDDRDGNLEIYSRQFDVFDGWSAETRVTNDPGSSRFPTATVEWGGCSDVVFTANRVVWQDDRDGNDEIYFAQGEFGAWSIESRVTTTSTPSRHPSLFSAYHWAQGPFGLVPCTFPAIAWEERTAADSAASIRFVDLHGEEPEVAISDLDAAGIHPSLVLEHEQMIGGDGARRAVVVWEDARDGNSEIYFSENEWDFTVTGVTLPHETTSSLRLGPAYPNPFHTATRFTLRLLNDGAIDVRVVSAAGREVTRLFRGIRPAGAHRFAWNGEDASGDVVTAGTYFVVVSDAKGIVARRIVRLR